MQKRQLELLLSGLKTYQNPKEHLEQYQTPASVAAEVLHWIYMQGELGGEVADLGCGTGMLGIGASVLGSKVYGVDIDQEAIDIAIWNEEYIEGKGYSLDIEWICSDISGFDREVDLVVQNPPFGIKYRHADRNFISTAMGVSSLVYSIHHQNPGTRKFIKGFVESLGGKAEIIKSIPFHIKPVFKHHKERLHETLVDLYRIEK